MLLFVKMTMMARIEMLELKSEKYDRLIEEKKTA